jgi:hypothetical protein
VPDPLAIYGALGATCSLGWQVWRERRRLRTSVRIDFEHGSNFVYGSQVLGANDNAPREYVLSVVVINDGETTEYVRDIGIEIADGRGFGFDFGRGDGDRVLAPRGRVSHEFRLSDHPDVDLEADGFVALVRLGSGLNLKTGTRRLQPEVLEDLKAHNSRLTRDGSV